MRERFSEDERQHLRRKLLAVIEAGNPERNGSLTDDASLIKSGMLDSQGLFNVAVFIEREVGQKVDIASFDLATEWDSINDMLRFIQKMR